MHGGNDTLVLKVWAWLHIALRVGLSTDRIVVFSVVMLTVGIVIAALADAQAKVSAAAHLTLLIDG